MKKGTELAIPFSILEQPIENNTFALVRFLFELVGIEQARTILSLLAQSNTPSINRKIDAIATASIRKLFPKLRMRSKKEIQEKMSEVYTSADAFIKELIQAYFFEMQFELSLLDNTTTSTTSFASRLRLLSSDTSTSRLKYELLRQDLLALLFLELEEKNTSLQNRTLLNSFQILFETQLYEGKDGTIYDKDIYSVHDNKTNRCFATFSSLKLAKKHLKENELIDTHIKKFNCRMREVKNIGFVLANTRIKSDFSILRKVFYKSKLEQKNRKKLSIEQKEKLEDTTGYLFVVPNGKREEMLTSIITLAKKTDPKAEVAFDHKVDENRGQSTSVNFLRIKVRVSSSTQLIEIIVFDQIDYMNYLYEFKQAHELFNLKKTEVSSQTLFPNKVYDIDPKKLQQQQIKYKNKIKRTLHKAKKVK